MHKVILSILILLVFACNPTPDQLEGTWILQQTENRINTYAQLDFKGDSVVVTDYYLFKQRAKYTLNNQQLTLQIGDIKEIRLPFQYLNDSSFALFESDSYLHYDGFTNNNFSPYELAGIKTQQHKNTPIRNSCLYTVHYYKELGRFLKIRLGDATARFCDLYPYLEGIKYNEDCLELFIGKDITLIDLRQLYLHLYIVGIRRAELILDKIDHSDYFIFNDRFYFPQEDIDLYFERNPKFIPPPPNPELFSKELLKDHYINQVEDFKTISKLEPSLRHIIYVNSELHFSDYIRLKQILNLQKVKKLVVLSESPPPLPNNYHEMTYCN